MLIKIFILILWWLFWWLRNFDLKKFCLLNDLVPHSSMNGCFHLNKNDVIDGVFFWSLKPNARLIGKCLFGKYVYLRLILGIFCKKKLTCFTVSSSSQPNGSNHLVNHFYIHRVVTHCLRWRGSDLSHTTWPPFVSSREVLYHCLH